MIGIVTPVCIIVIVTHLYYITVLYFGIRLFFMPKKKGLLIGIVTPVCIIEPFIDEVLPEEEEEFNLSVMDYMDSVALELVI